VKGSRRNFLGAVLAGGSSERLGGAKATAPLGGRTLIEYPLEALQDGGFQVVVVAKEDTSLPELDVPVWRDSSDSVHPLTGIVTSLERSEGRSVLVCACDLPFVTPHLAMHIARQPAAVAVPTIGGRLHPLLGRYEPAVLDDLKVALGEGRPLQETVRSLEAVLMGRAELEMFGDPQRLLFNVNTPLDLARAEALLRYVGPLA
jgi:molybdopterin-guanine dinucleotide biosynthesis protein A